MTKLGDGSVLTKLCSKSKIVEEEDTQQGKADEAKLQLLSYIPLAQFQDMVPSETQGGQRPMQSQSLVKWHKCKDQVKPDAKRYLTQTMKDGFLEARLPLAQSRKTNKYQMKNEWSNQKRRTKVGKALEHFPGGEKQNELFKDLGRWRAEVQANN